MCKPLQLHSYLLSSVYSSVFLCLSTRPIAVSSRNIFLDFTRDTGTEKAIGYNQCLSLCGKGLAHTLKDNFSTDMQLILWDCTEICAY